MQRNEWTYKKRTWDATRFKIISAKRFSLFDALKNSPFWTLCCIFSLPLFLCLSVSLARTTPLSPHVFVNIFFVIFEVKKKKKSQTQKKSTHKSHILHCRAIFFEEYEQKWWHIIETQFWIHIISSTHRVCNGSRFRFPIVIVCALQKNGEQATK